MFVAPILNNIAEDGALWIKKTQFIIKSRMYITMVSDLKILKYLNS